MALYAAYGSNLHPGQMLQRCPHSPAAGSGWIQGWRLTFGGEDFGWEGALATVVEDPGSEVYVGLYDVLPYDERVLDHWESADTGLYRKIRLRVHTLDQDVLAWTYVLNSYEGGLPSARYLGVIADAAETGGAPDDYVAALRERPCRTVGP
ncbi:MAG TPA: gamma-glutamylcyclotransferase [Mycobacteriales bacterium]|nr:gamma-glutamylcyclotransferase [Mycobacteriales bacterium]